VSSMTSGSSEITERVRLEEERWDGGGDSSIGTGDHIVPVSVMVSRSRVSSEGVRLEEARCDGGGDNSIGTGTGVSIGSGDSTISTTSSTDGGQMHFRASSYSVDGGQTVTVSKSVDGHDWTVSN
jgi:hypothetical protein